MVSKAASPTAVATALVLGLAGPAKAGVEVGIGLDATMDLPDSGIDVPESHMGPGIALRLPTRVRLRDRVAIRVEPSMGLSWGQDRVEWLAYEEMVPVYSDSHSTILSTVGLLAGPEISPWPDASTAPYMGASFGFLLARHWHHFDGQEERLLGLAGGGGGVHPYTDQLAPVVDVHGGLRLEIGERLAMEVEAGYNVAFMREARLAQAPTALEAVRTAYGLNQLRMGINLVIPLALGSKS